MSLEQERNFLHPFFARAARGEIATGEEIQRAFEAEVKHAVHLTSISRLVDRHGWRKLVPRPRHPSANPQAQAAFKTTLRRRFKRDFPHASLATEDPC
jgi:Winged helix-turn helix